MKLKPYTRENYRSRPLRDLFARVIRLTLSVGFVMVFGLFSARSIALLSSTPPASPAASRPAIDPLHDFHLVHGRLYGSRYKPISRVETDLPLTYETDGFDIELEWVGEDQNLLHAVDRDGRYLGTRLVDLTPRADMDDDGDVDDEDRRRFRENPFDMDIDGRVSDHDLRQFDTWIGWKKKSSSRR